MKFQEEVLTESLLSEMMPLLQAHKDEIAHYQDIPLKIDSKKYFSLQEAGVLKVFTAREGDQLVGYSAFFILPHIHYLDMIVASNDVLYLSPSLRGKMHGVQFIQFCDDELKMKGATAVTQHPKAKHNFGPMLERMGYELMDLIYIRRLN